MASRQVRQLDKLNQAWNSFLSQTIRIWPDNLCRYRRVAIRIRGSLSTTIVTSRMPTHLFWKNSWLCSARNVRALCDTNNVGPPVDYIDLRELYRSAILLLR